MINAKMTATAISNVICVQLKPAPVLVWIPVVGFCGVTVGLGEVSDEVGAGVGELDGGKVDVVEPDEVETE